MNDFQLAEQITDKTGFVALKYGHRGAVRFHLVHPSTQKTLCGRWTEPNRFFDLFAPVTAGDAPSSPKQVCGACVNVSLVKGSGKTTVDKHVLQSSVNSAVTNICAAFESVGGSNA